MTVDLPLLKARAATLDRHVRTRNRVELAASVVLLLAFGLMALRATVWPEAVGPALCWVGVVLVGRRFVVGASHPPADPTLASTAFVEQHRRALRYQAELLADVPRWYIAPLLPGMVWFYGWGALRSWGTRGFGMVASLAAVTALFIGWVAWINLRAARRLHAEADAL